MSNDPPELSRAPWDDATALNLNDYQRADVFHPFTCGECRAVLVAEADGWHCPQPGCAYRQNWAHTFMADGSWRAMARGPFGTREATEPVGKGDAPPDLLPCPFCGGPASFREAHSPRTGRDREWVRCDECGARSRAFPAESRADGPFNERAMAAWNRRAALAPAFAVVAYRDKFVVRMLAATWENDLLSDKERPPTTTPCDASVASFAKGSDATLAALRCAARWVGLGYRFAVAERRAALAWCIVESGERIV